jgi:hypothetical protein
MRKVYILGPVVLLAGFGVYYAHWRSERSAIEAREARDPFAIPFIGRSPSADAAADIAAGRPRLFRSGERHPREEEERKMLADRLGILLYRAEGCDVSMTVFSYTSRYNARVIEHFGAAKIQAIRQEAEAGYERHAPKG